MKSFKEFWKMKIEDQTAAFTILGAMVITITLSIGICEYVRYTRTAEVNNMMLSQMEQTEETSAEIDKKQEDEANKKTDKKEKKLDEEKAKEENEKEYEKLKKENKITSAADRYYIKVNYGAQVVNIYRKNDKTGKYEPYKAMLCSTGTYTPTSGVYRTLAKGNWWPLYGDVYGQYSTHIYDGILFHSVPYLKSGDKSSLEYWAYDQLGQRVSMGCVRLTTIDAKWIYENCPVGTQVEFYSSSNPGPFGKPTARKISSAPSNVRGWDPTDPDSRNPWPKYLKELEKQKEEEKKAEDKKDETNTIANEVTNEVTNEITNEITNETTNSIVNDVTNETTNDITNSTANEAANEITNSITNNTANETTNTIANNTANEIANETTNTTANQAGNNISSLITNKPVNAVNNN